MSEEKKLLRSSEVIYQIYPSSFCDSNGDGHGDLKGITSKLGYIQSLGVDAIWISPFFLTPEGKKGDGGYAITDYRKIAPQFGTMEDFEELVGQAHKKGLRVYNDFVLCHTADDHEWFQKSRKREPGFENRYVWHDGKTEHEQHVPPNNWKSVFSGPAWTFDEDRKQYYMHHFANSQPALNLNDTGVQKAVLEEMKFWLDKGVDGFRLDALPFANHDPQFRNNPVRWNCPNDDAWQWQWFEHSMCQPQTVELVKKIRGLLDSYPDKRTAIGEVIAGRDGGSQSMQVAEKYVDPVHGTDSCYTESLIQFFEYPSSARLKEMLEESLRLFPEGGLCNNASNHDFPRAASRMTANAPVELHGKIVRQMMALCTSLPGSFCMLQGEELRLPQARIPEDIPHHLIKDLVDPRPRDGARTPMPWKGGTKNAGFSKSDTPYLPVPESHYARAVDLQEKEPTSMLNFTRRILQERKTNPAMNRGTTRLLDVADPIFAFVRETPDQTALFAFNMSQHAVSFKPKDVMDAATLEKLHIPADAEIFMGAYGYTRRGLHGQEKANGTSHAPVRPSPRRSSTKRVFAVDMLIADHLLSQADSVPLIHAHNIPHGHKFTIDEATHSQLSDGSPSAQLSLGGSTGLTMWTLKKMLGRDVDVNLMGLAADDNHGALVKKQLKDAGVNLLTEHWPAGVKQQTAVSHVIKHANGQDSILTYPGTEAEAFRELRKHDPHLVENALKQSDIVYLPGSLAEKFGMSFIGDLLESRWDNEKELVLALPSHATFGHSDNEKFKNLIASANVVMGSDDEFCRIFEIPTKRPVPDDQLKSVTDKIQAAFAEDVLTNNGMPCPKEQVAFITRADKSALLVTAHKVIEVPAVKLKDVKNHLGAGDAVFAGFLAGYIKGLDHEESAALAMRLAAEKVKQDSPSPHLDDPRASYKRVLRDKTMKDIAAKITGSTISIV